MSYFFFNFKGIFLDFLDCRLSSTGNNGSTCFLEEVPGCAIDYLVRYGCFKIFLLVIGATKYVILVDSGVSGTLPRFFIH